MVTRRQEHSRSYFKNYTGRHLVQTINRCSHHRHDVVHVMKGGVLCISVHSSRSLRKTLIFRLIEAMEWNGKLYCSLQSMQSPSVAALFPRAIMHAVRGNLVQFPRCFSGKVTLVALSFNSVAQNHISSFVRPILTYYETQPFFQCYEVSRPRCVDTPLFSV
jgi:hypothetical protein